MKRPSDTAYCLTPQAEGWAVWRGTQRLHITPTLGEAAALLPAGADFEFALPCHPLIVERLRLPASERVELAGMVHLQWEKALPFTPEEITGAFSVIESSGGDIIVWSVAASRVALQEFGDVWSKAHRWPKRAAPYVCHVAAACPPGETVLVVYSEQGHWVVAVIENRRPGWVHVMSASDATGVAAEFPSLLLTAGLDGVPNTFARVLVSPEVADCAPALQDSVPAPITELPLVTPQANLEMNLLPVDWQTSSVRDRGAKVWRRRVLALAAIYLLLAVLGAVDLFLRQHHSSQLAAGLNADRPTLLVLQNREARFNSLGAAIDSRRYAIEVLYLLQRCLTSDNVQFTEFDLEPQQWRVLGEAPSPTLAIDYLSKLKRDPELSTADISSDPPQVLANGRAQFQVIGKP